MPPRPPPTHFLCIPLVTAASRPQLSASLAAFKADATKEFGVPEQAVRPLGTLHLTLGVMSFPPPPPPSPSSSSSSVLGLERATRLLLEELNPGKILADVISERCRDEEKKKEKSPESLDTMPGMALGGKKQLLSITLQGLRSMQPNAAKASVLYASPIDSHNNRAFAADGDEDGTNGILQSFCEKVRQQFQDAGLMDAETEKGKGKSRPLLLHATIVNTIYVKGGRKKQPQPQPQPEPQQQDNINPAIIASPDTTGGSKHAARGKGGGRGRRRRERLTLDARQIIDRYEDYTWMRDVPLEKIAICKMGAKKLPDGDNEDVEAYEVVAEVDI